MTSAEAGQELVVVGVDGSDPSKAALQWAVRYGRKAAATVRAVTAWRVDPLGRGMATPDESFEQEARANLEAALRDLRSGEPDFPVETRLQRGEPATVLLEQAQKANLLVFGGKGRGPVTGMFVGSVLTRFFHEAPCPVVTVGPEMGQR